MFYEIYDLHILFIKYTFFKENKKLIEYIYKFSKSSINNINIKQNKQVK